MSDTLKLAHGAVRMIAHRGVSGLEMENSNAAFVAAGNRSYFGIETDVHVTADGKFVIVHDDNLKRVSGADLCVEQSTLDELRAVRLFDRDSRLSRSDLSLPSLSEYIRICKRYEKAAVLELKSPMKPEALRGIADEIAALDYLPHTIFISFHWDNLAAIRQLLPTQPVQFLTGEWDDALLQRLFDAQFDLDLYHTNATAELVSQLHSHGRRLNCWTCNTVEDGERLVALGVDFITSNILE